MKELYCGGEIITMSLQDQLKNDAVLVENGKIIYVGSFDKIKDSLTDVRINDLCGAALLPSFIDSHGHFLGYAQSFLQADLSECHTLADIRAVILRFLSQNEIDGWVVGKGYDNNKLVSNIHPNAQFLDSISSSVPIVIEHASGHCGVFNTAGMKRLGAFSETGFFEETEFIELLKKLPPPNIDLIVSAVKKAQNIYASNGITTAQEGYAVRSLADIYKTLVSENILDIDICAYIDINEKNEFLRGALEQKSYTNHFRVGGYKIFLDGSPQAGTAWMKTPYANQPAGKCFNTMSDDAVLSALKLAANSDTQLIAHCNGDAAAEQFINCCRKLSASRKIRPVMVHAQLLAPEQLSAVKELGIIPSFFPAHIKYWGDVHIKNFGLDRASKISPLKSALNNEILFTMHQDTPVTEPNMLGTINCAVCRTMKNGEVLGADERISPYEALRAVTANAAYQYFEENSKGSISHGKDADFVMLEKNPLTTPHEELGEIKVLRTIKRGKTIFEL